ncbi:MAG: hypothetical protein KIT80_02045 [Chitinophagaceae bacterium]|nr:hypothetical protein [Chitinophagaceae bacterium]MCW5925666.1 hypothetical protein [Chitinophagaceae bacterium]
MKKIVTFFIILTISTDCLLAQDSAQADKQDIDPTKPTNLYTQLITSLEYQHFKNKQLFGVRGNIQYAFNKDNLMLLEIPILYNVETGKVGIGDSRFRYFTAVKRNISKSFIAIAPMVDITLPFGSYKNGIGGSAWSIAAGSIFGFVITPKFSVFPGVTYVHVTKPGSKLIPDEYKVSSNGIGLQFNASIILDKRTFIFINPTPAFMNTKGDWQTIWTGEFIPSVIITPNKFKVQLYWMPNFTADSHMIRAGCTFYF